MLIDVVPVVEELVPGLLRHQRPSVVCVRTTHQKYLVFEADPRQPTCVVEIGDEERLRRIHDSQSALYRLCPDHIALPLAFAPWGEGLAVHIQQGVRGLPWFRLFETLTTRDRWEVLLDRVVETLNRFHQATAAERDWNGVVDPAGALAGEMSRWSAADIAAAQPLIAPMARLLGTIRETAALTGVPQHGDFSLNNLMVATDAITVIDFEEFGLTRVPLHDAIGLGLSFSMSQDDQCPIDMRECVERSIGGRNAVASFDPPVMKALILHHLLWRINQSHGYPARARLRNSLTKLAYAVAADRGNGLDALSMAA